MPDSRIAGLLRRTACLSGVHGATAADATLLGKLARDRDPAAFTALLARHGPAVWAVCRRAARTEADAEDVFQATFLVLFRDAVRVRKAASVGSWLFGVAHRLGREARGLLARTPDPARLTRPPAVDPSAAITWAEVRTVLDEELARLPDGLRAPLLLCYYEGRTQDEAAAELGWSARAVKDRVARGRAVLRARLTRRGVELPAALAAPLLAVINPAPARATAALAAAAADLGRRRPPAGLSPAAVALARSGGIAMTRFRTAVGLACAAALVTTGTVFGLREQPPAADPPRPAAADPAPAQPAEPLPPGAAVRVGTSQFRQTGWHHRVFFTPDPDIVVVTTDDGALRFWHVPTGTNVQDLVLDGVNLFGADATPDGRLLAVGGRHVTNKETFEGHPAVWIVDPAARKVLRRIDPAGIDRDDRMAVRISADGKRVFTAAEGDIRVWDARTGDELLRHKSKARSDAFAVSPDGKLVMFGRYDLLLWRWETGAEPAPFARLGGWGTEVAWFARDGRSVNVVRGGQVAVWDIA
ncbi:MAG TPA: sigma-70 family RNA polymerase sigma factor, partial [Urbifossiella sp.]|nr:sigma-70 family RNA polymerase sigma factor [Urbifossiella sp.]